MPTISIDRSHDHAEENLEESICLRCTLGEDMSIRCVFAKRTVRCEFEDGNVAVAAVVHEIDEVDVNVLKGLPYVRSTFQSGQNENILYLLK